MSDQLTPSGGGPREPSELGGGAPASDVENVVKNRRPYRVKDDSVTVRGAGHPEYSGKSVTKRGEELRRNKGHEPGRYRIGKHAHPEKEAGRSTARDVTSVRASAENPILPKKMPNLR
jgi:hypothetical protein